jgi:methylmalonyl-CoA/ethylmalonyl-CoA epimerase
MKLHHYGLATRDLLATEDSFKVFGFSRVTEIIEDPVQKVKLLFLKKDNDPLIELVEPLTSLSPITSILKKSGSSLYHTCYEVSDIVSSFSDLRKAGFVPVVKPVQAIAFQGRRVAFLYKSTVGLIEILES